MKRIRAVRAKAGLFAGAVVMAGLSVGPAPAQAAGRYECDTGYVCFYSMANGYGEKCSWEGSDAIWRVSPGVCSWGHYDSAGSVFNNGTSGMDVLYYDQAGQHGADKVGCVSKGEKKNISGTHYLASHKWVGGTNC
ncbi:MULTISPECIES: peptidase inhibitor family I36 protein [unclassified Streptomyces]|uniref:peptidase inhibitor family I36 protein n=2 Tax=Streptomyces TaxID=1883 RepID=UPI003321C832